MNKIHNITPYSVTSRYTKKVWWKCNKGHEWEASVSHRSNGYGCPYCCNQKVCKDNCLATVNSDLAAQWHPTKNGSFTPYDVVLKSIKKVWWICSKGHEWETRISHRAEGSECPYCSNQKVNLEIVYLRLIQKFVKSGIPLKIAL